MLITDFVSPPAIVFCPATRYSSRPVIQFFCRPPISVCVRCSALLVFLRWIKQAIVSSGGQVAVGRGAGRRCAGMPRMPRCISPFSGGSYIYIHKQTYCLKRSTPCFDPRTALGPFPLCLVGRFGLCFHNFFP